MRDAFGVSNGELRELLQAVDRTPGFTVAYRRQKAHIIGPGGARFVKTGASGFDRLAVLRILHSIGWSPDAPTQLPPPPDVPVRQQDPVPTPVVAVTQEAPQVPEQQEKPLGNVIHGRYAAIKDLVYQFLAANPGKEFSVNELVARSGVLESGTSVTSIGPGISSVWLKADVNITPEWLHVQRRRDPRSQEFSAGSAPYFYSWTEKKRNPEPKEPTRKHRTKEEVHSNGGSEMRTPMADLVAKVEAKQAATKPLVKAPEPAPAPPAPPVADVVVYEEVATLPDGTVLLRGTNGRLLSATVLG